MQKLSTEHGRIHIKYLSDVFREFTLRLRQKKLSKLLSLEIIEPEGGKKIYGDALIDLCIINSRALHLRLNLSLKEGK